MHLSVVRFILLKTIVVFSLYANAVVIYADDTAMQSLSFAPVHSLNSQVPDNISGMVQDERGFLWVATLNGLYRYDGREFKRFRHDPRNNASLPDNLITSISLINSGQILLSTIHGGILVFNPVEESFLAINSQNFDFTSIKIQTLFVDGDIFWIGSYQGLFRFDTQSKQVTEYVHNPLDIFALPGRLVNSIIRDRADQLWIGTDAGLAILNAETNDFSQFPLPGKSKIAPQISKLYLDNDGSIWIGTEQRGLFHITGAGSRVEEIELEKGKLWIRDILRLASGELWVATENGLYVQPAFGSQVKHYASTAGDPLSLADNDVWSLTEDASNLVLIGTTKGLFKTAPNFANFGRIMHTPLSSASLSHSFVTGVDENAKGDVFISTLGGLDVFHPQSNSIEHIPLPLTRSSFSNRLQAVYIDAQQRIWLGDSNGQLLVLNQQNQPIKTIAIDPDNLVLNNRILFIKQIKNGDIWVGTERAIIQVNSESLQVSRSFIVSGNHLLGHAPAIDLVEDAQSNLWFATRGAGLIRYDPETDQGQRFFHQPDIATSLTQDTLNNLFLDERGDLWIATTNGLNRLAKDQSTSTSPIFETWFESDGLLDADIRSMAIDNKGWIWLSTDSGMSRVNLATKKIENYTEDDGLPKASFKAGALLISQHGQLYFGGSHGVSVITPEDFRRNLYLPKVAIVATSIRQGPWEIPAKALSVLSYDNNDIQFSIAAFDFHQPNLNRYRYRLLGSSSSWRDNQTSTLISYTNLDSGNYTLEVQATNNDGFWSRDTASYSFVITSPWWANNLAYIFYVLLFLTSIYWLYLNYRRSVRKERAIAEHLRRNDKLKDEFLAVISHELRTPLTGIIGITEAMMAGSVGTLNNRTKQGLELIVDSGKRLASLVNEILDFKKMTHKTLKIHLNAMDLYSVIQVVTATSQPLIGDKPVSLRVEIPKDLPLIIADSNRLLQILYNLVGNAIKFTEQGRVIIQAKKTNNMIELSVEDTGIGVSREHLSAIFLPFEQLEISATRKYTGSGLGLAITNQLVELHGSKLQVESAPNIGSRFYFNLQCYEEESTQDSYTAIVDTDLLDNDSIDEPFVQSPFTDDVSEMELQEIDTKALVSTVFSNQPKEGPCILVADDEKLNRTVICEFLNLAGYRTIEADCGETALKIAQSEPLDLLVLDVMMPRISGYEVCQQLRKTWSAIDLPVLLISAHSEPQDIVAGLEAGANDYISKPIDKNVLIARTKTLVMLGDIKRAQQAEEEKLALERACKQLSRYFPQPLVDRLMNQETAADFEASRRLITVLFADLVGFTELTDRFEAEVITDLLNQFINSMNALIEQHHGVLNEVLGDGLMVLIGAPDELDKKSQAQEVVKLSIAMQRKMKELGERWLTLGLDHNVKLRIGTHQDFATVGNIGSKNLIAYRAIGSGVNLTSRLQADCLPGMVRISYPIYALTRKDFVFQALEERQYKGFHHPHRVCTLNPEDNL